MKEYFIWLAKLLTVFLIVFVFFAGIIGAIASMGAEKIKLASEESKGVAVVELRGIIDGSDDILKELQKHLKDDNIHGVLLQIDSPGGPVAPSQAIYSAVERFKERKPIVAVMGTVAASGGLYAALGASKIYAQPGTLTGSIGVVLQLPNFQELSERIGIEMITIKSGNLKDAGNAFRPMTPEDREFFQQTADAAHEQFVSHVIKSRDLSREAVEIFSDGRILLGSEAKELGIIDEMGDLYQAGRAVYELAGVELAADEIPNLIFKDRRFEDFRRFFGAISRAPDALLQHARLNSIIFQ